MMESSKLMDLQGWNATCPIEPSRSNEAVQLMHGEGGRAMRRFIADRILSKLGPACRTQTGDSALLKCQSERIAFTTDSFVVSPIFFPGGDIGSLAVYGTVNDLAVAGACPRWLSLSLILEEGLPTSELDLILTSVARAATVSQVEVVTGDTKVVPRGAVDRIFINTAGLGELHLAAPTGPQSLETGDVLIISGPVGSHGLAVLCARESLQFDPPPLSDCAPLWPAISALLKANVTIRCLRDCTRGGLAAVLHEWAHESSLSMHLEESDIPIDPGVRGVSELLGLDPVFVAGEGVFAAAVPEQQASEVLRILRSIPVSSQAASIGVVRGRRETAVTISRAIGIERPLDEPTSALLPRIC